MMKWAEGLMFVVIYFLMIRQQSIQQKNHRNMLNNLKKGYKVLTRGGIIGKIFSKLGILSKKYFKKINNNWNFNKD